MAVTPEIIPISSSAAVASQKPSESHRLPTQSAADALQDLQEAGNAAVCSGLGSLDRSLAPVNAPSEYAGFQRGKVAEIWGPSGSGKTGLAAQTAAKALERGESVSWIDSATSLCAPRLKRLLQELPANAVAQGDIDSKSMSLRRLRYIRMPTLSHLLATILNPPASFLPEKTSLLVIDDMHTLVDMDYPRGAYSAAAKTEQQKWQAGRRYAILGSLVSSLGKLAVLNNIAVIVITGCSSRMRSDTGLSAAIGPGVGGSEWEAGIWSRLVLFRDFSGRYLGVQKSSGRNITPLDPVGDIRNGIAFEINQDGSLQEHIIDLTSSHPTSSIPPVTKKSSSPVKVVRKRVHDEIADSEEDEDLDEYGWAEKDDEVLAGEGLVDEHKPVATEQANAASAASEGTAG